ncbi:MAG: carbohydrate ABC transporter permease [Propionibacteriaceae bacterium]
MRRPRRALIIGAVLWMLALAFLMPFIWMVLSSLKRDIDVFGSNSWLPNPPHWQNYQIVWTGQHSLAHYFANSIIVATARVVGELATSSMAGYAFARFAFRGRDTIFLMYLATSIVPFQLLLVPRFMFFSELHLYDTLWALILPGMFTVLGTFLMRQYFSGLPGELAEAARIDGAPEWRIFLNVYLPLARPVLASLGILSFVWSWNDYEGPLIMLSSDSKYTVPLGLTQFVNENGSLSAGLAMAASVCAVVPIIVVFLVFQRNFLAALSHSGLK